MNAPADDGTFDPDRILATLDAALRELGARLRFGGMNEAELATRAVPHDVGDVIVRLASLEDIVASKEFANRRKDQEALPELRELARSSASPRED